MNIRHAVNPETGAEYENKFVALDEIEIERGSCVVDDRVCAALFPKRPHQICIDMEGPREALSALLGAATAQAYMRTREMKLPARIYTECQPDDTERIVLLNEFGYEDNDGLVRMTHFIEQEPVNPPIPEDTTALHDYLEDPVEARYFLMRYNRLYSSEETMEFVGQMQEQPGFRRYLLIAEEGLLGEVLVMLDGEAGRILFLHVNVNYRRQGIGTYLMQLAIYSLAQRGAKRVEMDVRVRTPGVMRFLKGLNFEQDQLLMRYLGMDWNPGDDERIRRPLEPDEEEEFIPESSGGEKPVAQDPEEWD
ncbi:MAG: GNAT family N-acetyltransferase [Clostridia bacterium]|nr:GNAT family N-acetyltransferase [Clostridia bacterium]